MKKKTMNDLVPDKFKTTLSKTKERHKSGGTRDSREGKGRFDLISPFALLRLARVYERGGKNHGDRNWEKGITFSRCLDSALRHSFQYLMGVDDGEDHAAQAAWNWFAIMHFETLIDLGLVPAELQDLPRYAEKKGIKELNDFMKSLDLPEEEK